MGTLMDDLSDMIAEFHADALGEAGVSYQRDGEEPITISARYVAEYVREEYLSGEAVSTSRPAFELRAASLPFYPAHPDEIERANGERYRVLEIERARPEWMRVFVESLDE